MKTNKALGIAFAVVAVVLAAVAAFFIINEDNGVPIPEGQFAPPNAIGTEAIAVHADAATTDVPLVTIYQDYQCPPCARAETTFGPHLDKLAKDGDIRLEVRTMTFLDNARQNNHSTTAAVAAACADSQGFFPQYNAALYNNQAGGYTPERLTGAIAKEAGLKKKALEYFQTCFENGQTLEFVQSVYAAAGQAGINSTPTYLVNGVRLDLSTVQPTADGVKSAIDAIAKG